ncbi:hypothetical protein SAMN03159417_04926 [Ralstonia sp. NFACC01]|nr:hypothetical protein SAMN03159417_04926 [Ralstonia sp. NFACC01]
MSRGAAYCMLIGAASVFAVGLDSKCRFDMAKKADRNFPNCFKQISPCAEGSRFDGIVFLTADKKGCTKIACKALI